MCLACTAFSVPPDTQETMEGQIQNTNQHRGTEHVVQAKKSKAARSATQRSATQREAKQSKAKQRKRQERLGMYQGPEGSAPRDVRSTFGRRNVESNHVRGEESRGEESIRKEKRREGRTG